MSDTSPGDLGPRTLTDADTAAIATEIEKRMLNRFYKSFGQGVWSLAWKAIIYIVVAIAAYGTLKSINLK
jgi:hypothetical protein